MVDEKIIEAVAKAIGVIGIVPRGQLNHVARVAIEAYEKDVGNLVKIDAVAMSRAMAIAGIKASTQDAEMTAEALRNLTKYHHLG